MNSEKPDALAMLDDCLNGGYRPDLSAIRAALLAERAEHAREVERLLDSLLHAATEITALRAKLAAVEERTDWIRSRAIALGTVESLRRVSTELFDVERELRAALATGEKVSET